MKKNNLIPPVAEVVEIEKLTERQQEKKDRCRYVLDNLDYYTIDVHGNFFNDDANMMNSNYYYIGREAVDNYEEIREKIAERIIEKKEFWEIMNNKDSNYRNRGDNRIMFSTGFTPQQNEKIKKALNSLDPIQTRGRWGRRGEERW